MNKEDIICPGETIKELLEINYYTQQNLADKLNMDLKTVNEILNGKAPITVDTALKLELIFGVDASFWNNLEFNYRKELKMYEEYETIQREYESIKEIYKEMVKRNLVDNEKDISKIVKNFKKFMEITSLKNLQEEYARIACRQVNTKFNYINLMVWLQIGLRKARNYNLNKYSKDKIVSKLDVIRELTLSENQESAREKLKEICNECGIILFYEKDINNTAIYGVAKWLDSKTPFIQMSDRGKNEATFWFLFMHELGHIIEGRKKNVFIDSENNPKYNDEDIAILKECEELKADKFARNTLIPEKEYKLFLKRINNQSLNEKNIIDFAKQIKISPCLVAGRLKYDLNIYNNKILNSFNRKIEFIN